MNGLAQTFIAEFFTCMDFRMQILETDRPCIKFCPHLGSLSVNESPEASLSHLQKGKLLLLLLLLVIVRFM